MFRVDLGEVFAGRRSARWAYQFAERVEVHPFSVMRAKERGGDRWVEWYGWGHVENKVAENTNVFIAANTPPNKPAESVWAPQVSVSTKVTTLEDASAALMSMI